MLMKFQVAPSSKMLRVFSVTSDSAPPITPAIESGPFSSQTRTFIEVSVRSDVIERCKFLAIFCRTRDDFDQFFTGAFLQDIIVKGMKRFAEFEHGVIGRIDNAVDRTHARQFESTLDLIWAGFNFNVANQP